MSSERPIRTAMKLLQDEYLELHNCLDELLEKSPLEFNDLELNDYIACLKGNSKTYENVANKIFDRYLEQGVTDESNEVRNRKRRMLKDVNQVLSLINVKRNNSNDISLLDVSNATLMLDDSNAYPRTSSPVESRETIINTVDTKLIKDSHNVPLNNDLIELGKHSQNSTRQCGSILGRVLDSSQNTTKPIETFETSTYCTTFPVTYVSSSGSSPSKIPCPTSNLPLHISALQSGSVHNDNLREKLQDCHLSKDSVSNTELPKFSLSAGSKNTKPQNYESHSTTNNYVTHFQTNNSANSHAKHYSQNKKDILSDVFTPVSNTNYFADKHVRFAPETNSRTQIMMTEEHQSSRGVTPVISNPVSHMTPQAQPQSFHDHSGNYTPINNHNYVPPQVSAAQPMENLPLSIMSKHLLTQDLLKGSIKKYEGKPRDFWPWVEKVHSYINSVNFSPFQVAQFLETNTTGEPQRVITNHLASIGGVTADDLKELWDELSDRFGSPGAISRDLMDQVKQFPYIKDSQQKKLLGELLSLCKIILFNQKEGRCPELNILNLAYGLVEIRSKLPENIQREWARVGQEYEDNHNKNHPPFYIFVEFLKKQTRKLLNSNYETVQPERSTRTFKTLKTDAITDDNQEEIVQTNTSASSLKRFNGNFSQNYGAEQSNQNDGVINFCSFHQKSGHLIQNCQAFRKQSYETRKEFAYHQGLCFRCLMKHRVSECKSRITCEICFKNHSVAMHYDVLPNESTINYPNDHSQFTSYCTQICKNPFDVKLCSRTVLVEVSMPHLSDKKLTCYAILDDQCSTTLVDNRLVKFFELTGLPSVHYTTNFASEGMSLTCEGYKVSHIRVRGVYKRSSIVVDSALSYPNLIDSRHQVATPEIAKIHKHTAKYAHKFPPFDPHAEVLLLLGADCEPAMADNILSKKGPYVHDTPVGFCLVGKICKSNTSNLPAHVLRTDVVPYEPPIVSYNFAPKIRDLDTFETRFDDEQPGMSVDDKRFIDIMQDGVRLTNDKHIELPLPIKEKLLPDNKTAVFQRTHSTLEKIKKDQDRVSAVTDIMKKNINCKYVEKVPLGLKEPISGQKWYLPIFCVEHKKKLKPRLVFDASARYKGVSLNDALYQGPDLNNTLRGVLLRFREHPIAFSADIQDMFSNFKVNEGHHDYLRFYWWDDNDPRKPLVAYRSTSHIFGCTSSPAVASYGLKYCASLTTDPLDEEAKSYLQNSFYVDDGLYSTDSVEQATDTLQRAIGMLQAYKIRLHKVASNSSAVLECIPASERSTEIHCLPSDIQYQHTLGVAWNTTQDSLDVKINVPVRPFTKRGILSVINSLYDPIGLVSPVILAGRLLQRELLPHNDQNPHIKDLDWDDELPSQYMTDWKEWIDTLPLLDTISIPRSMYPIGFSPVTRELHVFNDASFSAIGHVIYLRLINCVGSVYVAFISGSSKVAPRAATSIPRLELCSAMEATKAAAVVQHDLRTPPDTVYYHTDSLITYAYISNTKRRFSRYIERRVSIIHLHSDVENWRYISTADNPADIASRPQTPKDLLSSFWYEGPPFLWDPKYSPTSDQEDIHNVHLPEEVADISTMKTEVIKQDGMSTLIKNTGKFRILLKAMQIILKVKYLLDCARQRLGVSLAPRDPRPPEKDAEIVLIISEQSRHCKAELDAISNCNSLPENSRLSSLSPILDEQGVIRVGGRLSRAKIPFSVRHPIFIPKESELANKIIAHYHSLARHQGRHITMGFVQQAGYFIQNGRTLITHFISNCILCRKLRSRPLQQYMADLPEDRVEDTPPFTRVGIDVFGPFFVHDGINTRRTSASKKIWALILVCMPSRAVHIESLPGMDTSSLRNALTRFMAIRGQCTQIRSDQGSNFVCARRQLDGIDISSLTVDLESRNIKWTMNPPHASHFGGSWERKIGSVRRVLEGTLVQAGNRCLSRDEFNTLLAEASAIVNNTPLWAVPDHPNDPTPLTPAMLLTLKEYVPSDFSTYTEKDLLLYGPRRYRRVQYLAQEFWTRWRREYLAELVQRKKWQRIKPCLKLGDVVIIREKNLKRNMWPLGRVTEVKKSADGLIRSANIKIPPLKSGQSPRTVTRTVADLVLLLSPDDS